jgi:hypothetical protein
VPAFSVLLVSSQYFGVTAHQVLQQAAKYGTKALTYRTSGIYGGIDFPATPIY